MTGSIVRLDRCFLVALALCVVPAQLPAAEGDWPLFRGNPAGTGVAVSTLPEKLDVLWKFKAENTSFEATAVIAEGVVYVGDGDRAFHAIQLKTGQPCWSSPGDRGFLAAAAVRDGRVFIGDAGGTFHCFDAITGHELWKFETRGEINSSANFFEDSVLFGSQDGSLYRLKRDDGALVWKFSIEAEGGIQSSPTLAGTRVFFAGCDGKLHVIDVREGKQVASLAIDDPTLSTPAIDGDFVYFGTEGGNFLAVEWKEPRRAWTYRNPRSSQAYRSSAAVSGDLVVIAGRSKMIEGLARADGQPKWSFATGGRVDSSPVVVGTRVFVGSADGRLYALDLATGRRLWRYDAGGSFTAAPAVAKERLVIGNEDGVLYCFGKSDGMKGE